MAPGESVYGEKRVSIATSNAEGEEEKVEYRVWNPFRSKLAAGILGGLDNIYVSFTLPLLWFAVLMIRSNPEPKSYISELHPDPQYHTFQTLLDQRV